ncbi:MAG: response regulator [Rubrivivax sp.]|nr:response regulator [Rubrivivax sp.]
MSDTVPELVRVFASTTSLLKEAAVLIELPSRRLVHVNGVFFDTLAYAPQEVIGRTPLEGGWWPDVAAMERFIADTAAGGVVEHVIAVRTRDGSSLRSPARATVLRAGGGVSYLQLITCRRRDVGPVRLEHELMFKHVPVGIALTRNRIFIHTNPAFDRIFGWVPGRLAGQPGRVVWPSAELYADIGRRVGPSLARGEPVELELPDMVRPDGTACALRLLAQAVEPERGADGGTLWICEDITERIQLTRHLEASRSRAEEASHAKSQFLANMSHELRTPLNALLGLARLLQQGAGSRQRRREYLDLMADSAQGLSSIVSDILDLSKIEAGRLDIDVKPMDLHHLARSLHRSFSVLSRASELDFGLHIDPGVPAVVEGDPLRVRQILANFINNALKFTTTGSVQIRIGRAAGSNVRLAVHDTGPGFDDATRQRLFLPFSQADESTTRRFGGTGLGLSICRELAALMGGAVGADSVPGQGSVFWAELPLPPSARPPSASDFAGLDAAALADLNVLVVEDNDVNMMICVALLEQRGARVVQAADGRLALRAVREHAARGRAIDLVLMDLQMPVMGGLVATRLLRMEHNRFELPIIGLSAVAFAAERAEAMAAGMNDFVVKPIEPRKLERAILRAVAERMEVLR